MVHGCTRFFIQQIIFSLSRCDMDLFCTYHIVKDIRIDTRRIDHTPGLVYFFFCMDPVAAFCLFNLFHCGVKIKFCSVFTGILRKCKVQFKRTHNTAGRCIQGCIHFFGKIRLHPAHFIAGKNLKSFHTVFLALFFQFFQTLPLFFSKTKYQGTVSLKRNIQIFRQLFHHPVSPHIHLCHQTARTGIKSGMHDSAVRLGCSTADILFLFQYPDFQIIPG